MRWNQKNKHRSRQWMPAICFGFLLQIPLVGLFLLQTMHGGPAVDTRDVPDRLRGQFIALPPTEEELAEETLDRQLVEVPPEPDSVVPPTKAKYQADRNVRVKKQTRSRKRSRPSDRRGAQSVKVAQRSEVQSASSRSAKATSSPKSQPRFALIQPKSKRSPIQDGKNATRSNQFQGAEARLLLPATSSKNALANLQALDGGFTTDDHLPDEEEAESTLLNADKYKYADFFYRVKDAVRNHWHPASVYRTRDPSGKVYGVKDRNTVLRIKLDSTGSVISIVTRTASGLEFLDREARAAFRRAQPFANPPEGLVKNGEISFNFGFYFEISSGRRGFRWNRL